MRKLNLINQKENKMELKPLGSRIVIKRAAAEEITSGGIIVPLNAQEKMAEGVVTAVGPGRVTDDGKRIPLEVKVGDIVMFGDHAGVEVMVEGEEHTLLFEAEVLCIKSDA